MYMTEMYLPVVPISHFITKLVDLFHLTIYIIKLFYLLFLLQLFLKAKINLSELTDLILSQNYIGSVIKVLLIYVLFLCTT